MGGPGDKANPNMLHTEYKGNRIMCDFEMEQGEHFISNVRASLRIFVEGGGRL